MRENESEFECEMLRNEEKERDKHIDKTKALQDRNRTQCLLYTLFFDTHTHTCT